MPLSIVVLCRNTVFFLQPTENRVLSAPSRPALARPMMMPASSTPPMQARTLAASLLDMDFKSSVRACMGGVLLAGCIMGALSVLGVSAFGAVAA